MPAAKHRRPRVTSASCRREASRSSVYAGTADQEVDAFARRILGWRTATMITTDSVLEAVEQAIWTRARAGVTDLSGLVHHNDRGSQYTAIRFGERLAEAGIAPSVGSVGDSFDDALAETINGLCKTELIKPGKPWQAPRVGRRCSSGGAGRPASARQVVDEQ